MAGKKRRVFIVDGSGLVYRAHFALIRNPLVTTQGQNVSAVHGFLTTLLKTLREEKPDAIVVTFDAKGKTFRHERYPEYKANRPPMPQELREQIPMTKRMLDAMGVRRMEVEGVEADDLIGTLVRKTRDSGDEAVIVSADKDFTQLIGKNVRQWVPPRAPQDAYWLDPPEVEEKWGVQPEQMIDLLALMGDSSDNVPGVAGIGQKTAAKLIAEHGSLDAIYDHLDEIPQKGTRTKLANGKDDAFLSRDLVRIRDDLDVALEDDAFRVPDLSQRAEFIEMLRDLEFRRVLEGLGLEETQTWTTTHRTLETVADLDAYLEGWSKAGTPPLAWNVPAERPGPGCAHPVGLALCYKPGEAVYVALPSAETGAKEAKSAGMLQQRLQAVLDNQALVLVAHDIKAAFHALRRWGLEVGGVAPERLRDTMLASYLLDPEAQHDLASSSVEHLRHRPTARQEVQGAGRSRTPLFDLDPVDLSPVVCEEVDVARRLFDALEEKLKSQEQDSLWRDLECPLIPVLSGMEAYGVRLDLKFLDHLSTQMARQLERLTEDIHASAETEFNIASPMQLGEVLFDHLKLPKKKRTKTGYSTDSEVLESLSELHPVPRMVLEHRMLSKLKGTYVDALPELVDPETGRLHASFHQAVAATGRLSSSDPNIQNIPIRTETGREIRKAFVPADQWVLLSADYSQIELRVLAHLSGDPGLAEAFRNDEDVHAATAARLFGVDPKDVDTELRSKAKTVNFGVIYGMGPQRLSRELGLTLPEAKSFIADYFAKMPGVKGYMEGNLAFAREHGYTRTLFGRRRWLRGLNSSDHRARAQAERIASNTPIQGSAADLIKAAMLAVDRRIRAAGLRSRLILQVHDELVVEAPKEELAATETLLREAMEGAAELSVPLHVEVGVGGTWAEAHG